MDGVEALEWLLAQETLPDLILLDCMMPHMSGHEFCSLLRQVCAPSHQLCMASGLHGASYCTVTNHQVHAHTCSCARWSHLVPAHDP